MVFFNGIIIQDAIGIEGDGIRKIPFLFEDGFVIPIRL